MGFTPFEKKVWLATPTMHGEELKYKHRHKISLLLKLPVMRLKRFAKILIPRLASSEPYVNSFFVVMNVHLHMTHPIQILILRFFA